MIIIYYDLINLVQEDSSNQSRKESAFRAFDTESKGHIDAKDLLNSLRFTQVDEAEAQEFIK